MQPCGARSCPVSRTAAAEFGWGLGNYSSPMSADESELETGPYDPGYLINTLAIADQVTGAVPAGTPLGWRQYHLPCCPFGDPPRCRRALHAGTGARRRGEPLTVR